MFTADDARKNRCHEFIDKIFDAIREESITGSSLYVCFNGGTYPGLTGAEEIALVDTLTAAGYTLCWDVNRFNEKTLWIYW